MNKLKRQFCIIYISIGYKTEISFKKKKVAHNQLILNSAIKDHINYYVLKHTKRIKFKYDRFEFNRNTVY